MKIAGIPRNPKNSPNMSNKDMQLFHKIIEELRQRGHSVEILDENDEINKEYDAVFHMTRTPETLEKLAKYEEKKIYVTNSVKGVINCSREKFISIFEKKNIKQPPYIHVNENKPLEFPGWLKKSEGWSCSASDVQFVASEEEYNKALATLATNGCNKAIFCKHIAGDVIKFYGIQSENFFRWYYPDPIKTKFGLEKINGEPQKHKFSSKELRKRAMQAAEALNVNIFGGDCIITANGEIYIIDLNDFPSFSPCCDEAAKKISTSIVNRR